MQPKYTNVWARSPKVGSGTGGRSVAGPGPACFLADELVIRGLVSPTFRRRVDLLRQRGPEA
jgi:hypothetical protein